MWHEREREREHNSPPCKIVHGEQFTFKLVYVHGTIKLVLKDFIMHLLMFPVNTQLETIVVESLDGVPERYSATRGKKKHQKNPTALYIYFAQKVSQGLHWISPYVYRVSQYLLWVAMQLSGSHPDFLWPETYRFISKRSTRLPCYIRQQRYILKWCIKVNVLQLKYTYIVF